MDLEKYVDKLLQALDDDRVRSKISGLINKPADSEQQGAVQPAAADNRAAEYADLQRRLEEALGKTDEMEKRLGLMESEKQGLSEELCRQRAVFETYQEEKSREINKLKIEKSELKDRDKHLKDVKNDLESEIAQLMSEIKQLETDKKSLESENAKLIRDHDKIKKDNAALKSQHEDALKREKLLESYVGKPLSVFSEYRQLSEEERANLRTIISDKNVIAFVSSGSRQSTLDSLWDYIKNLIFTNGDPKEICILGNVFGYFFDLINESAGKALFVPDNTEVGDSYDDDKHIRTSKGNVQGKIKKIELIGYKHAGSGKIIKKTIVTVG